VALERPVSRAGVFSFDGGACPRKIVSEAQEKCVVTWQVTCSGDFDEAAMAATITELGGFWRSGWFIASNLNQRQT